MDRSGRMNEMKLILVISIDEILESKMNSILSSSLKTHVPWTLRPFALF